MEQYEFPPEDFSKIQIKLLIDILAHELIILDVVRKLDKTIKVEELTQALKIRRSEILRQLYAEDGKTPEV